jgi:16S rRNA (cytosine967-C5)-methyltransferase
MQSCSCLQDELLDAAAGLVRRPEAGFSEGGLLVYSTCSIEPEENEARVDAFLNRHPGCFAAEPAEAARLGLPGSVLTQRGFLATLPHRHGTDGAFAARLRRIQ